MKFTCSIHGKTENVKKVRNEILCNKDDQEFGGKCLQRIGGKRPGPKPKERKAA